MIYEFKYKGIEVQVEAETVTEAMDEAEQEIISQFFELCNIDMFDEDEL
jgi:hypothetical protein